jgi:hypothetical protein
MITKQILTILLITIFISCQPRGINMTLTSDQISQLDSLKNTYKFTDKDWDDRGLIPSNKSLSDKMNRLINECLSDLINSQNRDLSQSDYVKILDKGLKRFKKLDYDTEEKEFIAEKFHEIANIIGVDYNEKLNIWLYGSLMIKLGKVFKQDDSKILESITIQCSNCQDTLTKAIVKFEDNIPEYWTIVKCGHCGELNLFPALGNMKETRFINCTWIKSFAKSEFDSIEIKSKIIEMKTNN